MTMVICPNCGNDTLEGKFCEQCGAPLPFSQSQLPATISAPIPVPPPASQKKRGMPVAGIVAAVIVVIVIVIIILVAAGSHPSPSPSPSPIITIKITSAPTTPGSSHTPSETFYGHVDNGGTYRITTTIRDPTTSRYTIRLAGPKNTDLDLYVQKGIDPTTYNYDYKSSGFSSNEQIDIPYPALGEYNILVNSAGGSGDFVLYISYQYS
jgi:hypothetical protein